MTLDPQVRARLARLRGGALLVGLLSAAACGAGAYYQPAEFFPAWLVACLFWWGISLGSMAIAMIHHLTGGMWGLAIRRILEAAYSLLPLTALLFAPLLFGLPTLYLWARQSKVAADSLLQYQGWYLNVRDFQLRAAGYFIVWTVLALALNALSSGELANEPLRRRRLALISGPGLIVWGLTVTFAAIDWAMSLEPHWFSSSYGVLLASGQGVAALSLAIVALVLLGDLLPWSSLATPACLNDLGNFLLAFVMFWAYIAFTQYLIIWSGNLPEEIPWYLHRNRGGWQWVALALIGFHFAVPFLLLLARQTKRQPRRLLAVAVMLLLMRLLDLNWLVMPAFHPDRLTGHWLYLAAPLAVGGFWLTAFAWRLAARAALPVYELPLESEALNDIARHATS
jgi:hypothetical protein